MAASLTRAPERMRKRWPALDRRERRNRGRERLSGGAGTTEDVVLCAPHALAMQPSEIQRGIPGSGGVTRPRPPVAAMPKAMQASGGRNSMRDGR